MKKKLVKATNANFPKIIDFFPIKMSSMHEKWGWLIINWSESKYIAWHLSLCDPMKFKAVAIFMHRGLLNQEKSMICSFKCDRLCAKFHVGRIVYTKNFWILANIDFSAQTANKIRLNFLLYFSRSHSPGRASALDFTDVAATRFAHRNVVSDLHVFIEAPFF